MKKAFTCFILCISLFILSSWAFAIPSGPPPYGKVWVEVGGKWILVVAPPGDGPYRWKGGQWILDPGPYPPNAEWVPGHWEEVYVKGSRSSTGHWVPGHWERLPLPTANAQWVPGHWKQDKWIPGHWKGSPPPGKKWVPGHHGLKGRWSPGHWE